MTRRTFLNILLALVMASAATAADATVYNATKVVMGTSGSSTEMTLLGEDADGYQIWAGQTKSDNETDLLISIDNSSALISNSTGSFVKNKKFSLSNDFNPDMYRMVRGGSGFCHFLKVKDYLHADFFTWDLESSPGFAKEFYVSGNLYISTGLINYNSTDDYYDQKVSWSTYGINTALIERFAVEESIDGGKSWSEQGSDTLTSGTVTAKVPWTAKTVRYRVVAYPKDKYKVVVKDCCWKTETIDIDLMKTKTSETHRHGEYSTGSVFMTTGMSGTSADIYMSLLGRTKEGNQIWGCTNSTGKCVATSWNVYGKEYSSALYSFEKQCFYYLYTPYDQSGNARYIESSDEYSYFIKMMPRNATFNGKLSAVRFFMWDRSSPISFGPEVYVVADVSVDADEPTYSDVWKQYVQNVKWTCNGITDALFSRVVIEASYDGGSTWESTVPYVSSMGSWEMRPPVTATKVRYRVVVYPTDIYKIVVENEKWVSKETKDYEIPKFSVPCEFSVTKLNSGYTDNSDYYKRTYSPEITWSVPSYAKDVIKSITVEYSPHGTDEEWQQVATLSEVSETQSIQISGTKAITLPAAYENLYVRLKMEIDKEYAGIANTVTPAMLLSTTSSSSYSPAFTDLSVVGSLDDSYDEATDMLKPTLRYAMNDDLWQTRYRTAYIGYSTDGGATWTQCATVASPQREGTAQISIPADGENYRFYIGLASGRDNHFSCGTTEDTKAISYTPSFILTLSDTQEYTPQKRTNIGVKVERKFDAGGTGTICLPFAINASQIAEALGTDAKLYEFTKLSGATMQFSPVSSTVAGKPYLVKNGEERESLVFHNVSISKDITTASSAADGGYSFNGVFSPYMMKADGTELFITGDATLKRPSSSEDNNRLLGYRAYFVVPEGTSNAQVTFADSDPETGIDAIDNDDNAQPVKVYNLNGQFVGDSLNGLAKGVYIVKGGKYIVK